MAKKEVKLPPRAQCPGIKIINGAVWTHNPPHETAQFSMGRRGICGFCRGVMTAVGRWYNREKTDRDYSL